MSSPSNGRFRVLAPAMLWLTVVAGVAAGADPGRPAERPDGASKVAPRLQRVLAEDGRPQRVWVFFSDKGLDTPAARRAAVASVAAGYDRRAVERRRLRGRLAEGDDSFFDLHDVPVDPRYVEAVTRSGARVRIRSRWLNAVSAVATERQIELIAALPFVTRLQLVARARRPEPLVLRDARKPPATSTRQTLDYGNSTFQLNQINLIALHEAGYTGQGIVFGILDTGFRRDHEVFHQPGHELNVIAEYDFVDDDPDASNEPGDPPSQHNHGTLILGTIAAYLPGSLVGGAYDASFILCKTEDYTGEYQGEEDNYVAGLEFIEAHGGDVATSSLGYIDWYTQADLDGQTAVTTVAVNLATARGLHHLNAAGNDHHDSNPATSSLIAPADAVQVITVGALTSTGATASFSSDGPTADGRVKPEVMALGSSTQTISPASTTGYSSADGTSLSTPLAASAVACLVQARPGWSVDTLREQLFLNADYDVGGLGFDPLYIRGYGILDAMATHENASGLRVDPSTGLVSEGSLGGPFIPDSVIFTVGNHSGFPVDYVVSSDQPWVDISNASGTLAADGTVEITVSINDQAAGLERGNYQATIDFINTTDHQGDTSRELVLHVGRTIISVSPEPGFDTGGPVGGPFSESLSFTVATQRPTPVAVRVSADEPWIVLNGAATPVFFELSVSAATAEVTVGLSELATVLEPGIHTGVITFANLSSGEGDTTREVTLDVGAPHPVHVLDFEEDPGWSTTRNWQFGQPLGGGSHNGDPTSGHTGLHVYGNNLAGDYPDEMNQEFLTSTPFDCSALDSVALRFWRFLGVESSLWDQALVQASHDGSDWTTVWSNAEVSGAISDDAWTRVTYDISAIADGQPSVYLRWGMGPTNGNVTYPGWNIDDVELLGISPSERISLLLDPTDLIWTPLPDAVWFDVIRGDLATLRSSGGDFAFATDSCLANNLDEHSMSHGDGPDPGEGWWLLVRGVGAGGPMTYDSWGSSQAGLRDGEILQSSWECP